MNKKTVIIVVIVLVILALFWIIPKSTQAPSYNNNTTTYPKDNTPKGGGTSTNTSMTAYAKLGQTISVGSTIKGTVTELVQDNRCPASVKCIQAGTVKIKMSFVNGLQKQETTLTLGEPMTIYEHSITLTSVKPEKVSTLPLVSADYVFTFLVK